jgi:hypothetical protein
MDWCGRASIPWATIRKSQHLLTCQSMATRLQAQRLLHRLHQPLILGQRLP